MFHWIVLFAGSPLKISIYLSADCRRFHAGSCKSTVLTTDRLGVSTKIFAAGGGNLRKAAGKLVCPTSLPPHVGPGSRIASSCSVSCPGGNQLASIETVPGHGAVAPTEGRAVKMIVMTAPYDAERPGIEITTNMEKINGLKRPSS